MKRTSLRITREGWYYLAMLGFIIAGAVIRDINLLYIMAGMMLGPLLYSFYAAGRSLRRLTLSRRFDPLIAVGDPLYVEISATKPKGSPRGLAVRVQDTIQRNGDNGNSSRQANVFFPVIRPGQSVSLTYCARIHRRGAYHLGPLRASTGIPVGLVRSEVVSDEQETVKVSPQIGRLQPAWSRAIQRQDDGGQKSIHRRGRAEGDFYGMREWRDGDSRNWIHWRTSAKRMKLTVRQFQQPISQDLVVVLDLYHPRNRPLGEEQIESAISFAATLVAEQKKFGSTQLSVASASLHSFALHGNASPVFYREVMEHLAMVEADHLDRLPDLLAEVLPRATANAKVVLISLTARELDDSESLANLTMGTDARRSLRDILRIQVGTAEFEAVFRLEAEEAEASTEASSGADAVSAAAKS